MALPDALSRRRALGVAKHTAFTSGGVTYLGPMKKGSIYFLQVDQDAYWLQGSGNGGAPNFAVAAPSAGSSGRPAWAKGVVQIECREGTDVDDYVGVRAASTSGNAWLEEMEG